MTDITDAELLAILAEPDDDTQPPGDDLDDTQDDGDDELGAQL